MSSELYKLARDLQSAGYKEGANVLRGVAKGLKDSNLIPYKLPKEAVVFSAKDDEKRYSGVGTTTDGKKFGIWDGEDGERHFELLPDGYWESGQFPPPRFALKDPISPDDERFKNIDSQLE